MKPMGVMLEATDFIGLVNLLIAYIYAIKGRF